MPSSVGVALSRGHGKYFFRGNVSVEAGMSFSCGVTVTVQVQVQVQASTRAKNTQNIITGTMQH